MAGVTCETEPAMFAWPGAFLLVPTCAVWMGRAGCVCAG